MISGKYYKAVKVNGVKYDLHRLIAEQKIGRKLKPNEGYTFYAGFYKQINDDAFAEGELEKLKFCPSCGKRLEAQHE